MVVEEEGLISLEGLNCPIRVCNKWDSFVSRLKLLLDKLIEKGAKKKRLLMTLSKYFKNKAETKRFDISHHEI